LTTNILWPLYELAPFLVASVVMGIILSWLIFKTRAGWRATILIPIIFILIPVFLSYTNWFDWRQIRWSAASIPFFCFGLLAQAPRHRVYQIIILLTGIGTLSYIPILFIWPHVSPWFYTYFSYRWLIIWTEWIVWIGISLALGITRFRLDQKTR